MANPVGSFIWYELITPDLAAAGAFYKAVIGFAIGDKNAMDGMDYRMIVRDDGGFAGGAMALTPDMAGDGMQPRWMPYLFVENVDAEIEAIKSEGGTLFMPGTDIPGVGRIAMLADPQGIPIYIMTPTPPEDAGDATSDVFDPEKPQHVRWNELASPDQAGSLAFYAKHFGFEFNDKMSMGDMGDYCFIHHHGQTLGAVMQRQNPQQPALWLQYFGVPSLMAAKAKVEANGGTVVMGPMEVPGGDWIIVCVDPQGAGFGLVGPKGD
jgi:predicted enzyme related to lactoylglutathione lyase